jgi:hypothetical protein
MAQTDICSILNFTGLEASLCQSFEKQIAPLYSKINSNIPVLTNNLENIVKQNSKKIFIYDTIFQQLPWIIMFLILIIILAYTGVIKISTVIILIAIMLIVSAIFMYFYIKFNTDNVQNLINDINTQLGTNITNFKNIILTPLPSAPPS